MDEYIKREAAENAIRNDLPLSTWMKRSVDKALNAMGVTVATIDAIPAADVAPVMRGWWNVYSVKDCLYTCSVCNHLPVSKTPYCPFCGAKMENYRDV